VLTIAEQLRQAGHRWIGYELINHHAQPLTSLTLRQVESLGTGIDSWGIVDAFGSYIAGPTLLRHQISVAAVQRWTKRKDFWWRRAALVATTVLNTKSHGGQGDVTRTLAIAALLVADSEDMVVKGLSWALRCLVPWDPRAVERFLTLHEENLAARVKREVRNKLETGLKNPPTRP
jgi:3-methyladenine DNA glycosylase AlkD